jgi:hypothetical protein
MHSINTRLFGIIFFLLGTFALQIMTAQEKDSRGKDFWFTFIPNLHVNSPTTDSLYIYIAASEPTSGRLRYKGRNGNWQNVDFTITDPAIVFTHRVHWLQYELQGINPSGGQASSNDQEQRVAENVFHVTADKEVSVYALNQGSTTSDAFLVLPTDALGEDYYVLSYNSDRQGGGIIPNNSSTPSEFAIVATEDGTDITIKPSVPTARNGSSNIILARLDQGQSLLVQADLTAGDGSGDLTGSRVQANKPIGLFAGQQRARIPIKNDQLTSRDHIVEQLPSVDTWGRTAIVVPFPRPYNATNQSQDIYRVIAGYDSTDIMINGIKTTTLSKGGIYQSVLTTPQVISSNKSIMVAQYKKTSGTTNSSNTDYNGDPMMMLVPPSDQFQDNYRFVSIQAVNYANGFLYEQGYDEQWITIVMPNSAVASTRLDGQLIGSIPGFAATVIPGTNFSYTWLRVTDGVHTVNSNERVGIYVYGYGRANSYGYVGGMSFRSFDFNPPQITGNQNCNGFIGSVYDTVAGDSRIYEVYKEPNSEKNIKDFTYSFTPPQDSVSFIATLQDPYQDGAITVTAIDSVKQKTTLPIRIKGFTVSSPYKMQNNDSIQIFNEKTPLGKQYCFFVTLENYGSFDQIVKIYLSKGAASQFTLSSPQTITLKPKQQFTYQFCNKALTEGVTVDSVFIEDGCSTRAMATISLSVYVDKLKPTITALPDSCKTCHYILIADSTPTDGGLKEVIVSQSSNINSQNAFPNTDAVRALNLCVKDMYKDAFYEVQAEDKNGNITFYKDTIPGFTISSVSPSAKLKNLGGIAIGSVICDSIVLVNKGLYEQIVNEVNFARNVRYSIPRSILPLLMAPGDTAIIPICYAPIEIIDTVYETNRDRDTVSIGRDCITMPFYYEAFGVEDSLIANGKCQVTIKSAITDLALKRISKLTIQPHPISIASNQSRITFSLQESKNTEISLVQFMTGQKQQIFVLSNAPSGDYSMTLNANDLNPGGYMLIIQADGERESLPIIIQE